MLFVGEVIETSAEMGQIPVSQKVFDGSWYYLEDPNSKRLVLCANLVLARLYRDFTQETLEERISDIFQDCQPPVIKKADGTSMEIPLEVLCHGIVAEYFLQMQDVASFKLWNDIFESDLANIRLGKAYKPLPKGRWV